MSRFRYFYGNIYWPIIVIVVSAKYIEFNLLFLVKYNILPNNMANFNLLICSNCCIFSHSRSLGVTIKPYHRALLLVSDFRVAFGGPLLMLIDYYSLWMYGLNVC